MKRRWRAYETATGRRPVQDFLEALPDGARAEVLAGMKDVRESGLRAARHLRRDIFEVRASHDGIAYRVLFANEGRKGRVLLALEAFDKKSQKTPQRFIDLAESRLKDWRARALDTDT